MMENPNPASLERSVAAILGYFLERQAEYAAELMKVREGLYTRGMGIVRAQSEKVDVEAALGRAERCAFPELHVPSDGAYAEILGAILSAHARTNDLRASLFRAKRDALDERILECRRTLAGASHEKNEP